MANPERSFITEKIIRMSKDIDVDVGALALGIGTYALLGIPPGVTMAVYNKAVEHIEKKIG